MKLYVDDHSVSDTDILTGARTPRSVRCHPGNKIFESLVFERHEAYQGAKLRATKLEISRGLVDLILGSGRRFLLWNNKHKMWQCLTLKQCQEKTAVALKNKGKCKSQRTARKPRQTLLAKPNSSETEDLRYFDEIHQVQRDALSGIHAPSNITAYRTFFDVYCVKGSHTGLSASSGNKLYVALVKANASNFKNSEVSTKSLIAHSILFAIMNRGGRFLVRDGNSGWEPQSIEASVRKIAQALRDTQRNLPDKASMEATHISFIPEELVDPIGPDEGVISEVSIDSSELDALIDLDESLLMFDDEDMMELA